MISSSWNNADGASLSQRVMEKIRPDVPLRNKIDVAQRRLQTQISKLEHITEKLQKKDNEIFDKVVTAQKSHNNRYAQAYAGELAQVRKMKDMVNGARLSMEQIQLRLNTVSELGDVVVTLSPCMAIINGLKPSLNGIMPEANASMQDLSQTLGDIMSDSSMAGGDMMSIGPETSADTNAILEEAHTLIAGQTKNTIPDVPDSLRRQVKSSHRSGITT
ncbi:MAG: Snf7 family protein [Thaumarchaeota archaeon]|nr:Snf7 family protein [Nitrososphaerota archaeon]